jgi:hypothetical protein
MKYWHPHLPFGQHISVSTLVKYIIYIVKFGGVMELYVINKQDGGLNCQWPTMKR